MKETEWPAEQATILLVDDVAESLSLLGKMLSRHIPGSKLLTASSGAECIDISQRHSLDLVLLDAKMPDMDGFETCRRLKNDPATGHLPVLMVSGVLVDTRDRIAGLECGADGYVCKPFEPLELIAQVRALLRIKRAEDELRARGADLERELSVRTRNLIDSEQRFRILFEQSPDAIFVESADGIVLDVNEAACKLHGLRRDQLVGRNVFSLVPDDQRAAVEALYPRWFSGDLTRYEGLSVRSDGTKVPVEILANRTQYEGRPAVLFHVRDVSFRKDAERALQMSEARYRAIIEDQSEMITRWLPDGTLTFINESACRFWGRSREQLLGKTLFDWLTPEDAAELRRQVGMLTPSQPLGFRRNKLTGAHGARWTQWSNRALFDNHGRLIEVQSVGRDVTDQHVAEERLRSTSAGLRAVVEVADELIACPDLDTLYRRAVELARSKLGFERAGIMVEEGGVIRGTFGTDMSGHTTDERHHRSPLTPEWRERFRLRSANEPRYMIVKEEYRTWTGQMNRTEGSGWIAITPIQTARQSLGVFCNDAAITGSPAEAGRQEILAVFCSLLGNILERKKAEAALRQSQKMESIGRLAGGIAHDFNNLLTAILGFARLVQDGIERDSPFRTDLQEVINSGERAARLTKQLLAFGRKQVVQMRPLDLNAVVVNMDQILRRTLGEDVELVTMLGENLGVIEADPGLIEQVIMNLAVNARDAMPGGGKLVIATARADINPLEAAKGNRTMPGPHTMLSIRDTGVGMSPDVKEHIFEPFFTTKETGKGSGLGLSTVYGIVVQCGGFIEFDSETGVGSEFRIFFPRSDADEATRPAARESIAVSGGTEHVLLVEDESTVRRLTQRCLESLGYRVTEARNGEEALRIFRQDPKSFDLILTDVVMPHMGGPELVDHLRRTRNDLRILFMSGFAEEVLSDRRQIEHSSLLLKPFTKDSLAIAVRQVLDHS